MTRASAAAQTADAGRAAGCARDAGRVYGPSDRGPRRAHRRHLRQRRPCTTRWSTCSPGRACWARRFEMRALPGNEASAGRFPERLRQRLRRRSEQLCQAGLLQGQALRVLRDLPPRPPVLRLRPAGQSEYPAGAVDSHWTCRRADRTSLAWPQVNAIAGDVQHGAPHDGHQPDALPALKGDLPGGVLAEHLPGADA